jgi:hypothetical protein
MSCRHDTSIRIHPNNPEEIAAVERMEDAAQQRGLDETRILESWGSRRTVLERGGYFRGLCLRGVPFATRIITIARSPLEALTIVRCSGRHGLRSSNGSHRMDDAYRTVLAPTTMHD